MKSDKIDFRDFWAWRRIFGVAVAALMLVASCGLRLASADEGKVSEPPDAVAVRLQHAYERTTSIQARFQQVTSLKMSRQVRKGSGKMTILKPGRMRWDYQTPEEQIIICDGEKLRMYLAKARQMMVASAKDYIQSDVTYGFFAGTGSIIRDFEVLVQDIKQAPDLSVLEESEKGNRESQVIRLVPRKPHPHVEYLHVWVDNKTSLINQLQIVDQLGSVTDIFFSKIKTNEPIALDRFSFTPPVGTEIIEN